MKLLSCIFICASLLLNTSACFQPTGVEDVVNDSPHFPRMLPNEEGEQMEALLSGTLVFQNNCFRILPEEGHTTYTPIWPAGFDYRLESDSIFIILNAAGNEVARTGLGIRVSGGAISDPQSMDGRVEDGLPKLLLSCPVPYWIIGNEVGVYEAEAGLPKEVPYALNSWFDFYQLHIDNWRVSAFELEEEWKLDSLQSSSTKNIYPLETRATNWLISSPDERYNLDLYARKLILDQTKDGAQYHVAGPDAEAALEDRLHKTRHRLLFCGTPCRFEDGYWQDAETVFIAGLHKGDHDQFHPTIWKINLKSLTVKRYHYPTPLVSPFPHNYIKDRKSANT